jgi:hypothetical protein
MPPAALVSAAMKALAALFAGTVVQNSQTGDEEVVDERGMWFLSIL